MVLGGRTRKKVIIAHPTEPQVECATEYNVVFELASGVAPRTTELNPDGEIHKSFVVHQNIRVAPTRELERATRVLRYGSLVEQISVNPDVLVVWIIIKKALNLNIVKTVITESAVRYHPAVDDVGVELRWVFGVLSVERAIFDQRVVGSGQVHRGVAAVQDLAMPQ